MSQVPCELEALQRWFAHVVTDPRDVAAGLTTAAAHGCGSAELLAVRVRSSARLDAAGRLEVYRHGYQARLIDCLIDDYSALQHALGKPAFKALCRAYIEHKPSRSPSLNVFGAQLAEFLLERGEADAQFHADLARLEWAIVEVIHAHDGEPLALTTIAALSAQAWASARLVPSGALRLLATAYPVNAYFQAFRDQRSPELPAPEPGVTLVRRRGAQVARESLTPPAAQLLAALLAGAPLANAMTQAAEGGVTPEQVGAWFQHWLGAGLFVGLS